ncbi:hypothetical protein RO3G_02499 [Rhizopus delemar RA 99-880]|uniref:Uncharacterized protein n=1 Tax=Rhizopus delemar (strain RA 99-880 / ATCC MYA-4621 / FGSC 9543 / NRRL 43880) TaxID=246409 RepID=I1BNL5_RHIO9|nr:hypothetical protein RO3G_02499 [Rhizopus delemar RA 99-880]|eukprot:EIE77795.1 hypothetical protein RO3G_02499 [Rhizopus delemar RA 99-880]
MRHICGCHYIAVATAALKNSWRQSYPQSVQRARYLILRFITTENKNDEVGDDDNKSKIS